MKRRIRLALAAGILLLAANEAGAQFGGGGFPGGGTGRRGGARGSAGDSGKSAQRPSQPEARADVFQTTLEELRVDLKLDAAQQSAWNSYTGKLAALMSDLIRERNRSLPGVAAAPQGAPQQLDRIVMTAQNRATAIEDVAAAAKALYAMLSPEQKSVADARLAGVTSMAISTQTEGGAGRAHGK